MRRLMSSTRQWQPRSAALRSGVRPRPAGARAALLRSADLLEQQRDRFMALLQSEGGKTLDDALSEVREAVDFCRYYAAEGVGLFGGARGAARPRPAKAMCCALRGRGVMVAISPWNFPLAIFMGQVTAALMAGQCGGCQTRRTDAADRCGGGTAAARSRCAGRPPCISRSGMARSAQSWWLMPMSRAWCSPDRPKLRDPSTGRWRQRTARSFR